MAKQKVAGWYWVVTTALIPVFVIAALVWVHFQQQRSSYRNQAARIETQVKQNQTKLVPLQNQMSNVATVIGFGMKGVNDYKDEFKGAVKIPAGVGEEDQKPQADRNPVYVMMRRAEADYYGTKVQEYMSSRKWLDNFERKLKRYISYKAKEGYTLETSQLGATDSTQKAKLTRTVVLDEERNALVVPPEMLDNTTMPLDSKDITEKTFKAPVVVTLELIMSKQFELINQLAQANKHQYSLLYAGVSGVSGGEKSGWVGYKAAQEAVKEENRKVGDRLGDSGTFAGTRGKSIEKWKDAEEAAIDAAEAAGSNETGFDHMKIASGERRTVLEAGFQNEIDAAKRDAEAFQKMTISIPLMKNVVKLQKSEADGKISFSDFTRKLCHINLGRSDNVRSGQRFEVWRTHGRERDKFIGIIEIIRTLSNSYSLCTVLSLTDNNDPVRQSDTIVSRLYHKGRFLKIALHGSFEAPNETYSKARLTELLRLQGCEVVDKVQIGVDLTIVGSNLLGDEWYRAARTSLRFETMKEDDVRLYVDPR